MSMYRIKNPDLAAELKDGERAWYRHITPITEHYIQKIAAKDYRGKRLAFWGHLTSESFLSLGIPLKEAGAEVIMGACNVDSTDDIAAAYAVSKGVRVYGWQGMTRKAYQENLAIVREFEADYLCDMGGELSVAYLDRIPPVKGALEATTTGLHLLKKHELPFPVFDWNSIPLKDLHNRYHVGDSIWPAFNHVTQLSLYGKRILVIGAGPVGKGIAERARDLGGLVQVTDLNAVRLLEVLHIGCEAVSLEDGLKQCDIIVTATGVDGVLGAGQLRQLRPGAILFNAGHSNREIDIDYLYTQDHERVRPHIDHFNLGSTHLFLLGQGNLLNLSAGVRPFGVNMFDYYTAVMLAGIAWMFEGIPEHIRPGLQRYPDHLEREIAQVGVEMQSGRKDR